MSISRLHHTEEEKRLTYVSSLLQAYPVFVSDAMEKDVLGTIRELALAQGTGMEEAAARWRGHIEHGRWEVREDEFWCTPLAFWEMPDRITSHLEGSRMCFVKGDANYRRQLGERQWKHDTVGGGGQSS